MKADYYISKQFQDDLIKAYNSVAYTCWSQVEAYKKTVKQPAPRYYVSSKQAAQILSPMIKGDFEKVNMMLPNRKRMYYSLFDKVVELSGRREFFGKPLEFITQFAVTSPAPEFFVEYHSVAKIRTFLKMGYYDNDGKVVNNKARRVAYEKLKEKRRRQNEYRQKVRNSTL